MAFPVVEARATGRTTAVNTTSHPITLPSGIVVGDLLLVVFSVDASETTTPSSGWTQLANMKNGTVVTGAIFYKVAEGGDTLTITTTTEQSSHVSFRISGAGTPTCTGANGSSTNSNPPNHTNPGGVEDVLWIATRSGDSTIVATVAPASFSNLQTIAAAGTSGASSNTAERQLNAASLDPGTFTSATEQWVSFTIAVPPVIILTAIGDTIQEIWNIRKAVPDTIQLIHHVRAVVSDTMQSIWHVLTPVSDTVQSIWHVLASVVDSTRAIWHVKKAISNTSQFIWNVLGLVAVSDTVQLVWHMKQAINKTSQSVWHVFTMVGNTSQIIYHVRKVAGDMIQAVWNIRETIGDSVQHVWYVLTSAAKSVQAIYHIRQAVSDTQQFIWDVLSTVLTASDAIELKWHIRESIGQNHQYIWNVRKAIAKTGQFIWNVASVAVDIISNLRIVDKTVEITAKHKGSI